MNHRILVYTENTGTGKKVRSIMKSTFPGSLLTVIEKIQDIEGAILLYPLPDAVVFYFSEINVNEAAHFTKILQGLDQSKTPAIILFNGGVDLSFFSETKPEALFSVNMPEGRLSALLKSYMGDNADVFIETRSEQADGSETKSTLDALRETERQVSTMIDNLPGVAYRCKADANWTMKFISKNTFELTGYASDDFLDNKKLSFNDVIFAEDRDFVKNTLQTAILENRPFQLEYRIVTKSKKLKWVWEQGRQVEIQGLDEKLLEGLIIDITERKRNEIRLDVMKNISDSSIHTRDLAELSGLIERELGKLINTRNFIIALYDEKTDSFSLPLMKDERDFFTEIPAKKTISWIAIKRNKSMLLLGDDIDRLEQAGEIKRVGSPAKCWLGVPLKVKDKITGIIILQDYEDEHAIGLQEKELLEFVSTQVAATIFKKQADEEIRRLYQSIQQSPISVIITDTKGKIIYVNQKYLDISGYTRDETIDEIIPMLKNGNLLNDKYKNLRQTVTSGIEWQGEILNNKKDGSPFWESVSVSPVRNNNNEITHYIALIEDITARKQMEEDLMRAKEKAEESDRLKTAFLSNMSHEIRTPMNAIIGFTEMLHDGVTLDQEREKYSKLIIDNGRKLMGIIDDIVDIAKIEAGQLAINPGRCSANKIIFDHFYSFRELRSKLGKEHIEITVKQHTQDKNFIFHSDPQRINQVMSNLMSNALKYTIEGSIELGYKMIGSKDGNFIDFYVKDTGIGIKADNIEKIFDRFRQLDDSSTREYRGTGLGLAISIHLARLLGGNIDVKSEFGKGSTFHLILPFTEIVDDYFEPAKPQSPLTSHEWSNKKILIAEDEDSNFHLLEIMLRKSKVKIVRAYNGKEAIDFIRGGKEVDLILMDVRMPLMDGYEATALIKKVNPEIPIVAQTAYALSGDRETSLDAGCDAYISKPIRKGELLELIGKYLDK
jgi:PAS domain S-box-containing protein